MRTVTTDSLPPSVNPRKLTSTVSSTALTSALATERIDMALPSLMAARIVVGEGDEVMHALLAHVGEIHRRAGIEL